MADIVGLSFIWGTGVFHFGKYKGGVWFDNNDLFKLPKEERSGYGLKVDICFGRIIRPIGLFWKKEFWDNEKLKINDIPENEWNDFFGIELANKLRKLKQFDSTRLKRGVYNPWYALRWFVLRLPKWVPFGFISVGLGKLWSFYIGNKSYKVDPFTRDITWTNKKDRGRAMKELPAISYYALCPSATSRKTRMT